MFLVLKEIKKELDPSMMQLHSPNPLLLDIAPDLQQCLGDLVHQFTLHCVPDEVPNAGTCLVSARVAFQLVQRQFERTGEWCDGAHFPSKIPASQTYCYRTDISPTTRWVSMNLLPGSILRFTYIYEFIGRGITSSFMRY